MHVLGIHHISVIAGNPQANVDFHNGVLGLRFVKRTVNFDDPSTYHLYYGDATGSPGSLLTFFPWSGVTRGMPGAGEVASAALEVPVGALDWWAGRLRERGVGTLTIAEAFGELTLSSKDGDGFGFVLVERADAPKRPPPWAGADVPAEAAVRAADAVTLSVEDVGPTREVLEFLGYADVGSEAGVHRMATPTGGRIDLTSNDNPARPGAGSVHHVAFRVPDDEAQLAWRQGLADFGLYPTPVRERCYFRSIYFREPGGVLFELATDGPGMAIDEAPDALGAALQLPPWLEADRARIQAALPPLDVPAAG